jgi:AhpD family alkylhydroperoxidase
VDPVLPRFAADLDWLASQGVEVQRFNLAQQPKAFSENTLVMKSLKEVGNEVLPLIVADGVIASQGKYPTREELAAMAGIASAAASIFTDAVKELVAIGAAIASNCEPCFKFHYDKARKLGVSNADMRAAVSMGQTVNESSARMMLELADRYLDDSQLQLVAKPKGPAASGCCGPSGKDGGCC